MKTNDFLAPQALRVYICNMNIFMQRENSNRISCHIKCELLFFFLCYIFATEHSSINALNRNKSMYSRTSGKQNRKHNEVSVRVTTHRKLQYPAKKTVDAPNKYMHLFSELNLLGIYLDAM